MTNSLIHRVEKDIANILLDGLEAGKITFERAAHVAEYALANLDEDLADDQVRTRLPLLQHSFTELSEVLESYADDYDEL